ncbi:fatty acyl-AMP ligase [Streptomyces acidiscabies]|uniref:fatty acyl-AMP ligase n=1 Tax=Streptomyces acidiscabies TaxID=42234 RepID=UPI000AC5B583|nr:fatty acyl-AMP ligase [Streptomyces acidiscabies]
MGYDMIENITAAPSLGALLRDHVRDRAGQDAVVFVRDPQTDDADTLTYAQLDRRAGAVADVLRTHAAPGDRVLLLYPQSTEGVAAFAGCLYAGTLAVVAPMPGSYQQDRKRVTSIVSDAGISVVLTDSANLEAVQEWAGAAALPGLRVLASDTFDDAEGHLAALAPAGHETPAMLQYTSGSTSEPKGVTITHGNLLHDIAAFVSSLGAEEPVRTGGWAPLYHDMGLIGQTLAPLAMGSTVVLMSAVTFVKRPVQWLRLIDRYDLRFSAAPNFAHDLCVAKVTDEQLAGLDLSRWRYALSGGEPAQASTIRRFTERFAAAGLDPDAFGVCYGLAECTVFVAGSPERPAVVTDLDPALLEQGLLRRASDGTEGRPVPGNGAVHGVEARIVDPGTREDLPAGSVGEIWLRGPSVARGYWENPQATAETFQARTKDGDGPFLRTGDLGGFLDGELYVTGRRKDLMIINGRNLHPQDVEHALRDRHDELDGLPGAVFSVPVDGAGGANEEALVVMQEVRGRPAPDDAQVLVRAMRDTVSREFGVRAAGVLLLRRAGVRRTTSGKIQRAAMRDLFLSGAVEPLFAEFDARHAALAGQGRTA